MEKKEIIKRIRFEIEEYLKNMHVGGNMYEFDVEILIERTCELFYELLDEREEKIRKEAYDEGFEDGLDKANEDEQYIKYRK